MDHIPQTVIPLRWYALIVVILLLAFCHPIPAHAGEETPIPANAGDNNVTFDFLCCSYHMNRDAGYNERNPGLGMTFSINERHALSVGGYRNSHYERSNYVWYNYKLLGGRERQLRILGGPVSGYDYTEIGGALLYQEHLDFWIFKGNYLNLFIIPDRDRGVVAIGLSIPTQL